MHACKVVCKFNLQHTRQCQVLTKDVLSTSRCENPYKDMTCPDRHRVGDRALATSMLLEDGL